jgi:hypothetical protein
MEGNRIDGAVIGLDGAVISCDEALMRRFYSIDGGE